jgi:hypothetical protein
LNNSNEKFLSDYASLSRQIETFMNAPDDASPGAIAATAPLPRTLPVAELTLGTDAAGSAFADQLPALASPRAGQH